MLVGIVKFNWNHLLVSMPSMESPPDILASYIPCLKKRNPAQCIRIRTKTVLPLFHKCITGKLKVIYTEGPNYLVKISDYN